MKIPFPLEAASPKLRLVTDLTYPGQELLTSWLPRGLARLLTGSEWLNWRPLRYFVLILRIIINRDLVVSLNLIRI